MKYLILAACFFAQASFANTMSSETKAKTSNPEKSGFESHSIGHLVSSNTETLPEGVISVGSLYAAYGISETWSLGTSPFAYSTFSMVNLLSRWGWAMSDTDRIGVEFDYYKTVGDSNEVRGGWRDNYSCYDDHCTGRILRGQSAFKMEAWDLKFSWRRQMNARYRLSLTGSYYNYIDDERPFSLRMDPQNEDLYALTFTSLHEFKVTDGIYFNLEGGVWGANYTYPYLHTGATINLQTRTLLIGLGASATFCPQFPRERIRYFAGYDSRFSIHPEIQIQAFF